MQFVHQTVFAGEITVTSNKEQFVSASNHKQDDTKVIKKTK